MKEEGRKLFMQKLWLLCHVFKEYLHVLRKLLEGKFCKSDVLSYAVVYAYQRKRQIIWMLLSELEFKKKVCI